MSVPHALLTFVEHEARGVYQLRQLFTAATTWKINIGQVYQTMKRLARDGLVESAGSDGNAELFRATPQGKESIAQWIAEPIMRSHEDRNDLIMKIVVAAQTGHNVSALIQHQRKVTIAQLRDLTQQKIRNTDLTHELLLEHHIFELEAQARWLDHIEALALKIAHSSIADSATAHPEEN